MATPPSDTESDRQTARSRKIQDRTRAILGERKKTATALVGGGLLLSGLKRRSFGGAAMAVAGGWLVSRALGEEDRIKEMLRTRTPLGGGARDRQGTDDLPTVSRSITIGKPADELYETWRDPDQFSKIMGHFAEVTALDENRLRWTVHGPFGRDITWETRIVEEEPGEYLRWKTPEDAMVLNEGSVRFSSAPADRGTEITFTLDFDPPGGSLGTAALQQLDIVPRTLVGTALDRFKALVETGEIPTLKGNSSARGAGDML